MAGERVGLGHGKLLLFGEHSAVYGYPACGLTLSTSLRLRILDNPQNDWQLPDIDDRDCRLLTDFLAVMTPNLPVDCRRPGEIRVDSDIPQGMGFGSSAAWCVAFVRAMLGSEVAVDGIWEAAHRAEAFFHGTPSGIDTGLSVLDGLYAFAPAPPALPGARRLDGFPLHFLIGAAPRAGSTHGLVAGLRERIESGDGDAWGVIERLGKLSAEAIGVLAEGDSANVTELGRLADAAHQELANLGLSTSYVDQLLRLGRESGAVGGKLSGAGGGGAFYLLFKDPETADAAHRSLSAVRTGNGSGEVTLFRFSWVPE